MTQNNKKKIAGIVSPPYLEAHTGGGIVKKGYLNTGDDIASRCGYKTKTFTKQNISRLKDEINEDSDFDLSIFHSCNDDLEWRGCYSSHDFDRFITNESMAHPAKMSFGLAERIFKHLEKLGLLKEGMTICDFMAGSGRTNIVASARGYKSIAVELEPHFTKMIEDNKKQFFSATGRKAEIEVIQADSRKLSEVLKEKGFAGITSPPYYQSGGESSPDDNTLNQKNRISMRNNYALNNLSNIGNLPDHKLVRITSPLYESSDNMFHDPKVISEIENNIERQRGESYLSAMLQVYQEAYKSGISPLVTVTKNPTRDGKLRRLDLDTAKLLEISGYKIIDYHRSILFTEKTQKTLFGEVKKIPKGRISFFKRLSMQKGNVAANYEDVIVAVIPRKSSEK